MARPSRALRRHPHRIVVPLAFLMTLNTIVEATGTLLDLCVLHNLMFASGVLLLVFRYVPTIVPVQDQEQGTP